MCFGQPVDSEILTLLRGEVNELCVAVQTWRFENCFISLEIHLISIIVGRIGWNTLFIVLSPMDDLPYSDACPPCMTVAIVM